LWFSGKRLKVIAIYLSNQVGSPLLAQFIPPFLGKEDELLELHKDMGKILVKNSMDQAFSE